MRTLGNDGYLVLNAAPAGAASGDIAPVSVVIPCYRCSATIGAAVASVARQTLLPAEVLLIDDGSGDDTLEVLHGLAARHRAGWIRVLASPTNQGPAHARNLGWQHATQEYLAFLDADDSWAPAKLALQMAALQADPTIALIGHRIQMRKRGLAPPPPRTPGRITLVGRRRLLLGNPFPTPTVVLRRDLPFRFNERFRRVEDFLLWAQIGFSGYRCARINQVLAFCHKPAYGADGLSGDLTAMHQAGQEVRRELLRQGLVSRSEARFTQAVGLLRRARRRLLLAVRHAHQVSP